MINDSTEPTFTIDILKQLPKAELHRHLDGSIRISTLVELAAEQGVGLFDEEEMKKLILKDRNCSGLVDFLKAFEYTNLVLQHAYALTRVFFEVCQDAEADGVTYLEIRFSPILHTLKGLSYSEIMTAVCEGMSLAELKLNITVRIIVCGLRHLDPQTSKDLAEITCRFKEKGAISFDLAGPENGFSSKNHFEAFSIIKRKNLNITLHSGEDSNWNSVADSIYCGLNRIGHGIAIQENQELLNYVVDRKIPIECCITSNYQIKALAKPGDHPIRKYFDQGAIVCLCTDNVTMSNITLSSEYKLAIDTFNFNTEQVLRLIDYSFSSAFIGQPIKLNIRRESFRNALRVLKSNGFDLSGVLENKSYYFEAMGLNVEHEIANLDKVTYNSIIGSKCLKHVTNYPTITLELLKGLPKSDLHCRFDGSVSIDQMWKEIEILKTESQTDDSTCTGLTRQELELLYSFADYHEFKNTIQNEKHTNESISKSKILMNLLLQNQNQIIRGFDNIIQCSLSDDNIHYLELIIRPSSHTKGTLSKDQVISLLVQCKNKWESTGKIKIGLILYSTSSIDNEIETLACAKLAVENRLNGVIGFGILGGNTGVTDSSVNQYKSTFDYLKENNFNLVHFSGESDVESILNSIHIAGANRLSAAFHVHKASSDIMDYLCNYKIPVEISLTEKLRSSFLPPNDLSFTTPIRNLLDSSVPVVICSFHSSLYSKTRSEMLFEIVQNEKLNFKQVVCLLKNSFAHNFQSNATRIIQTSLFNSISKEFLRNNYNDFDYSHILI